MWTCLPPGGQVWTRQKILRTLNYIYNLRAPTWPLHEFEISIITTKSDQKMVMHSWPFLFCECFKFPFPLDELFRFWYINYANTKKKSHWAQPPSSTTSVIMFTVCLFPFFLYTSLMGIDVSYWNPDATYRTETQMHTALTPNHTVPWGDAHGSHTKPHRTMRWWLRCQSRG